MSDMQKEETGTFKKVQALRTGRRQEEKGTWMCTIIIFCVLQYIVDYTVIQYSESFLFTQSRTHKLEVKYNLYFLFLLQGQMIMF